MNERIQELVEQSTTIVEMVGPQGYTSSYANFDKEKFAELIVAECARIARATPCPYEEDEVRQRLGHTWDMASLEAGREIVKHFGVEMSYSDLISDGGMDPRERELIGYTEREEGFYPLYAPPKGSIVTHAFILCKYCDGSIYHCMGPRSDAVCLTCYEKDPDAR